MDPGTCTHDLDFLLNGVVRATADIREENLRLRTDNERLEKTLSELMPELEQLRKERVALKAALRALVLQNGILPHPESSSRKQATFATLPSEILEAILNYAATESTYQFDPSIQGGSYAPWLQLIRTKRGFPLICRAAFWPGMAVLYSDIVLRRMGQVCALADTLRQADIGPRLGNLIKSIRWDSCIVATPCSDAIREDITFIFGQCTQLQSFSYHPHHSFPIRCGPPDDDECEGFFNPLWFITVPASLSDPLLLQSSVISNLRFLDILVDFQKVHIGDDRDVADVMLLSIHKTLSTLKGLESLILGPWPSNSSLPSALLTMPDVSLPSLTELHIFAPEQEDVYAYLCTRWDAPRLTRLTIHTSTGQWSPMRLLERHGSRLRYLHLYPVRSAPFGVAPYIPTLMSSLSTMCPLLEHLVVPHLASPGLIIDSSTLIHLDVWTAPSGLRSREDRSQAEAYRLWTVNATRSTAPALRTVRLIFIFSTNALLQPSFKSASSNPDWPWICHPSLLANPVTDDGEDDTLYYRFPLGIVAQTPAAIIPQDLWEKCWKGRREQGRLEEQGGRGEEHTSSDSDWMSDNSDLGEPEEGEGDQQGLEEHDIAAAGRGENIEETSGDEELQDVGAPREGIFGEQSQQVDSEEQVEQDGDGETKDKEPQAGAAAELVSPEYPPLQLDRATVLAAFRRGRDRESYRHVAPWN
ncbi:hypothetical protein V8D89_005106 [Ganoderma adspersum]